MAGRAPVSAADLAWLHLECPENLMMITGVMWFDAPVDWAAVAGVLQERLVDAHPRFRQRVVEGPGGAWWEDDPAFTLERHLRWHALPAPGDQAALEDLVSGLLSEPLPRDRPPWCFHLVDGFEGGAALLGRLHHVIADGIALARVLLSLADPEGPPPTRPAGPPRRSRLRRTRAAARGLAHEVFERLHHPDRWLSPGAEAVVKLLTLPDEAPTALRGPLGRPKRAAWSRAFSLEEVKAVGQAAGATINDVLLACVAGALRRHLLGQDGPVVDVTTFVPVNLRPLDGPIALGNRFGLVFLRLPVSLATPSGRLRAVKERMDAIKHSPEALLAFGLLTAMGRAPSAVEQSVVGLFGRKASAVMTNVPGPRAPLRLAGHEVSGVMFWVPQSGGVGLGVSIFSYAGQVLLGVAADEGRLPRPRALLDLAEDELRALASDLNMKVDS